MPYPSGTNSLYTDTQTFINQYDVRRICQLLSDTGAPVTQVSVLTNPVLLQILYEATGIVAMAARVGQKYSENNLESLGDVTGTIKADDGLQYGKTPSGNFLRRLVGDIAYGLIIARRGLSAEEMAEQAPTWPIAMGYLEQLRSGDRIFDIGGAPDAGLPNIQQLGSLLDRNMTSISSKTRIWGAGQTIYPVPINNNS